VIAFAFFCIAEIPLVARCRSEMPRC
jgi:hypothetical protein